jgi:NADPH:quinone reductase
MKAILCTRLGRADDLVLADIPVPESQPGELLIQVAFAALNFFDTLIIAGQYQFKPDLPFSPGGEFCGRVVALGAGVEGIRIGQRVAGFCGWGACRDYLAIKATQVVLLPDDVADEAAAGLFITYGTALHGLADRGQLRAGETLAVLGASGGAGLAAVEIGAALGAHVVACASDAEKLAVAQAHGASVLIDYSKDELKVALRAATQGRGVDVVYDPVGGDFSEAAIRSLAWRGRFLVVGFASGSIPSIPLNLLLLKGCDLRGVFWGAYIEREPQAFNRDMERILAWLRQGKLKARVHAVFSPETISEALSLLSSRKVIGKLLVKFQAQ